MSQMQTILAEGDASADGSGPSCTKGVFASPGEVIWYRSDWASPVASFSDVKVTRTRSKIRDRWVHWACVRIPELNLERTAALQLLQGMSTTQLLIPNHYVLFGEHRQQLAHQVIRVDSWEFWRPVPRLTGLVLANLADVPRGVHPTEVLASLAADSALA